jgi:predicted DNA-binding transcriptional regulator YafY
MKFTIDYSSKCYIATNNFLQTTLHDSKALATILIIKVKSQDKYSPDGLTESIEELLISYTNLLEERIYSKTLVEKLDTVHNEQVLLENAIASQNIITCFYNEKERELYPLKIINLEGFWYLVNWDVEHEDIRRYHLKSIKNIKILDDTFDISKELNEILERFDYAINAFFEPLVEPFSVELFIDTKVAKYFLRMPISKRQRVMKTYDDGSIDLEIYITDYMEIVPVIQRYMPYISVIESYELIEILKCNINNYIGD